MGSLHVYDKDLTIRIERTDGNPLLPDDLGLLEQAATLVRGRASPAFNRQRAWQKHIDFYRNYATRNFPPGFLAAQAPALESTTTPAAIIPAAESREARRERLGRMLATALGVDVSAEKHAGEWGKYYQDIGGRLADEGAREARGLALAPSADYILELKRKLHEAENALKTLRERMELALRGSP